MSAQSSVTAAPESISSERHSISRSQAAEPNGLGNGDHWNLRANGPAICLEVHHAPITRSGLASHSLRENVDQYIRNQAEHHARISYKDEYRRICEKHEIEIDERYVWD